MNIKSLPEMQSIATYLRNLSFRKALLGGYDKEEVKESLAQLANMYDDLLARASQKFEEEQEALRSQVAKSAHAAVSDEAARALSESKKAYEELKAKYDELEAQHVAELENLQMEFAAELDRASGSASKIEAAGKQLIARAMTESKKRIDAAEKEAKDTVAAAQREARAIIKDAEDEAKRKASEAQETIDTEVEKIQKSLAEMREQITVGHGEFGGVMGEFFRLVHDIESRDESIRTQVTEFVDSMGSIVDSASRLTQTERVFGNATSAGANDPLAFSTPSDEMWNNWLNSILEQDDSLDEATAAGHNRFAASVTRAKERMEASKAKEGAEKKTGEGDKAKPAPKHASPEAAMFGEVDLEKL